MSKETVAGAVYAAGGATLIIHPHAAIGAAIGCCFFLAVPWGAGQLEWWRRMLLCVFSYGMGYAAGAYLFALGEPNGAMLAAGAVSALAAIFFSALNRTTSGDDPLPAWLGDILDRLPFLKRKGP